jgi:hypothetical protein
VTAAGPLPLGANTWIGIAAGTRTTGASLTDGDETAVLGVESGSPTSSLGTVTAPAVPATARSAASACAGFGLMLATPLADKRPRTDIGRSRGKLKA